MRLHAKHTELQGEGRGAGRRRPPQPSATAASHHFSTPVSKLFPGFKMDSAGASGFLEEGDGDGFPADPQPSAEEQELTQEAEEEMRMQEVEEAVLPAAVEEAGASTAAPSRRLVWYELLDPESGAPYYFNGTAGGRDAS
jgi:hypothetical protein